MCIYIVHTHTHTHIHTRYYWYYYSFCKRYFSIHMWTYWLALSNCYITFSNKSNEGELNFVLQFSVSVRHTQGNDIMAASHDILIFFSLLFSIFSFSSSFHFFFVQFLVFSSWLPISTPLLSTPFVDSFFSVIYPLLSFFQSYYRYVPYSDVSVKDGPHIRWWSIKDQAFPLQAWSGPEGSRKLRFPDFMTTVQDGGKIVSLMHRPPLPPRNTSGTHFC